MDSGEMGGRLTYGMGLSSDEMIDVFRLRYRACLDESAIAPTSDGHMVGGYEEISTLTLPVRSAFLKPWS